MSLLSFLQFRSRRRAHKLYDEARELIADGSYEEALVIGRKLRKLRYSGAFEIEGLAYQGLDRPDDAVRVLREGVAIAPTVWLNWSLLGNCLSDLGRYDEALDAYDRAEGCGEVEHSLVNLNRAIVALRRGDHDRALELTERVDGRPFQVAGVRATALRALGRRHEAEHLAMRTLEAWRVSDQESGKRDIGELARIVAELREERGEDAGALRSFAIDWWRETKVESLLVLIRGLRGDRSPDGRYFRVLFGARFPRGTYEGIEAIGYWMSGDAVADTAEEALAYILELVPPPAGADVEIDEALDMEPRPDGTKGVYDVTGQAFFENE